MARRTCNGVQVPILKLALEKQSCVRGSDRTRLATPDAIADFMRGLYGCAAQERVYVVLFNAQQQVIGVQDASTGGIASAQLDPRVVFAGVVSVGASALVIVHNHPSGSLEPSADDVRLTEQLRRGAELLGVRLLDHLIVTRGGYTSLAQRGVLKGLDVAGYSQS